MKTQSRTSRRSNFSVTKSRPAIVASGNPWPLVCLSLASSVLTLSGTLLWVQYLHHSVARCLTQQDEASRMNAESYRGVFSRFVGDNLLDAARVSSSEQDRLVNLSKDAQRHALAVANQSMAFVSHNPRATERLIQSTLAVNGIDSTEVAKLDESLRLLPKPRLLCPDCRLKKLTSTSGSISTLHFELADGAGKSVHGLLPSDIAVCDLAGNDYPHFTLDVASSPMADLSMVVLVDQSASMEGERTAKLKAGLERFISNCASSTRLQIVAFDSKTLPLTTHTNDHRVLQDAVSKIVPSGATEIANAVSFALSELKSKPGFRSILLCTDGQDAKLKQQLEAIAAECTANKIRVNVLAMDDDSLDQSTLLELTRLTGGQFCLSSNPLEINVQIDRLIESFSHSSYRLSVFNPNRTLDGFRMRLIRSPEQVIEVRP